MSISTWPSDTPSTVLIGAGVVGTAIAEAHFLSGQPFCLCDVDQNALDRAKAKFQKFKADAWDLTGPIDGLFAIAVVPPANPIQATSPSSAEQSESDELSVPIVIESIVEQLPIKQDLFRRLSAVLSDDGIFASNTSTLRIDSIADAKGLDPTRVCGLHFFMPVHQRPAVEIVQGSRTAKETTDAALRHAERIGKRPIRCKDGPGFIVNRMLSPYLNQSLQLLCRGASPEQLERVAIAYGMPMSPLELIDWIGAPTMFHAGRAYLNAFPSRLNPSPMIPALVKQKLLGRSHGLGLYRYVAGERSRTLCDQALALVETYRTAKESFSDGDVLRLLSIPMWIEAQQIIREQIAKSMDDVDAAMVGGLGFNSYERWSELFEEIGSDDINDSMNRFGESFPSMRPIAPTGSA
ncbi:3-hydroxyacyl-CoA dehydrogenase [Stieleria sp. JC731]|uniref:3-hydroxyacyl-CoA dehydrogenase n=1 Tax=Pirellulaceae TaxID=2691357 RepID=UPI001E657048|nr:3-hydroxyacyl-CoA dehydrogenase [Stieleria sp. JC731]MCC9603601.1 3-hydroxyacyl-CoA dehydrogenase [Stieleria sp. JC731]